MHFIKVYTTSIYKSNVSIFSMQGYIVYADIDILDDIPAIHVI